jgi:hypothetical protein
MKRIVKYVAPLIILFPGFTHAVCPLCIGIALSGSVISKFIPGPRGILITSLWLGFFLYATIKYSFEKISIKILVLQGHRAFFVKFFVYLTALIFYVLLLYSLYLLAGKDLKSSWFFAYHTGFFAPMAGYECYHWLSEKGLRVRFGNVVLPVALTIFISFAYYFC